MLDFNKFFCLMKKDFSEVKDRSCNVAGSPWPRRKLHQLFQAWSRSRESLKGFLEIQ